MPGHGDSCFTVAFLLLQPPIEQDGVNGPQLVLLRDDYAGRFHKGPAQVMVALLRRGAHVCFAPLACTVGTRPE